MCESETETGSLFVIQCVKAPIPISMIISYSLWAKTATLIQFISPLLTGAEMLDPAEVTSEVFRGCRVVEFVLRLGRESCSYRVADLRGPAYIIVYLPDRILVFTEHLVASRIYMIPWAKVYQFQKYTCFFKRKKKIKLPSCLYKSFTKFRYHLWCLHSLVKFHVRHPEASPVNHSDIQFTRIDDLPFLSSADVLFICLHPWLVLSPLWHC